MVSFSFSLFRIIALFMRFFYLYFTFVAVKKILIRFLKCHTLYESYLFAYLSLLNPDYEFLLKIIELRYAHLYIEARKLKINLLLDCIDRELLQNKILVSVLH